MVPLDVRKKFWAWCYGQRAFEHCRICCDHILKENMDDEHPLYYSLNLALHIHYGRPFRKSYGVVTLQDQIIPALYKNAHEQILAFRDKVYAHSDANPMTLAGSSQRNSDILFSRSREGAIAVDLLEPPLKPEGIKHISDLCGILIGKCKYHALKIVNKHTRDFPVGAQQYRIGIDQNEPPFTPIPRS